jgi:starch synthase
MRVLFASAELAPLVTVGGLAEAASGLVRALRSAGVEVDVVIPDYFDTELDGVSERSLAVPGWASPASARTGILEGFGELTLVDVPGIRRPNPYVDADGAGWPDNADRFFAFSAAVVAIARSGHPDIVHCNDWHTGPVLGLLHSDVPSVLTIHTLGYQGWTSGGWLDRLTRRADLFEAYGGTNPLAGAVQLADRVIAVSPHYAEEIRTPEGGSGLHVLMEALGERLIGIRNGIDVSTWDPSIDSRIPATYGITDMDGKAVCRSSLLEEIGWARDGAPVVAMVTRLVDQKGVDLALDAMRFAERVPFRLAILGSGERWIADRARALASEHPTSLWFREGFDAGMAHRLFAGADLFAMPSRFEPCGLAQMQAMAYGTIPVVTDVGGLHDTVVDADASRDGTGFVSTAVDPAGVVDALHRAVRGWKQPRRRAAMQRRGMAADWSWEGPAAEHIDVYEGLIASGPLTRN